MTRRTALPIVFGIALGALACGGLSGGGSEQAQSLCEHLAKERDCACVAVGAGGAVSIDGLALKVDKVTTWTGKDSLPEIQNLDERARLKAVDRHTLAVEVSITNTQPVKGDISSVFYLMDGDGEKTFNQSYNSKVYLSDKDGWIDFWNDDAIGPGKTRPAVLIFPLPSSAVEGSVLVLQKNEKRPDPDDPAGRMKTFTNELYVLDLGPPT